MSFIEVVKLVAEVGFPTVCAGLVLLLFFRMINRQQKWLEDFIKGNAAAKAHPSSEDVEVLEVINNKIYQESRGVLNALGADRSYVYLYHNGGVSSSGLYFQKMSCICEVVNQGVLPVSGENQAVYRASYAYLCDNLKSSGFCSVPDAHALQGVDNFMYQEMISRHAQSSYFRALKDVQNNVIGFIGVDYCAINEEVPDDQVMKLLKSVSLKISSLVDVRDEVSE